MAHELGICSPEIEARLTGIENQGQSLAILGHTPHEGCEGKILGILAIGDTMRPEAANALTLLHDAGIEKVVMLSGDNQRTASAIAKQCGIDEAHGDLLPDQKIERVKALITELKYVGMIGDGVNDAPAMAAATVGIAMGGAGTDTAIETLPVQDAQEIAAHRPLPVSYWEGLVKIRGTLSGRGYLELTGYAGALKL